MSGQKPQRLIEADAELARLRAEVERRTQEYNELVLHHEATICKLAHAEAVVRAAEAFHARVTAVHQDAAYQTVWQISQMHIGPYKGPTWATEYMALGDALAAVREGT